MSDWIKISGDVRLRHVGQTIEVAIEKPAEVTAFTMLTGLLLCFMTGLAVWLAEYGFLAVLIPCLILVVMYSFKSQMVIFDFEAFQVVRFSLVFGRKLGKQSTIRFQPPLTLRVLKESDSEGDSYSLYTTIEGRSVFLIGLNEPEFGEKLIRIMANGFPDKVKGEDNYPK